MTFNYGNRRLIFVSKEQEAQGWERNRHHPNKRKVLRFTVKQWAKFDEDKQTWLCKIYHVKLTDHKTTNEKLTNFVKKFNLKNFQKGTKAVSSGIDDFSKAMKEFHVLAGDKKDMTFLGVNGKEQKKNYDFLTGGKK